MIDFGNKWEKDLRTLNFNVKLSYNLTIFFKPIVENLGFGNWLEFADCLSPIVLLSLL